MESFLGPIKNAWIKEFQKSRVRWAWIIAMLGLVGIAIFSDEFFHWVEGRPGNQLHDPLLAQLPSQDLSYPIFALLYLALVYLILRLSKEPKLFLWFVWAFLLETGLRFTCIALIPLDPPLGLLPLRDPLLEYLVYGENQYITKDLFFSGHTATMVFVAYFLPSLKERIVGGMALLAIMGFLMIQHIHYSLDIFAALPLTWVCIWISKKGLATFLS